MFLSPEDKKSALDVSCIQTCLDEPSCLDVDGFYLGFHVTLKASLPSVVWPMIVNRSE